MAGEWIGPLSTLVGGGVGMALGGPSGSAMGAKIGSSVGGLGTMFSGMAGRKKAERMRPSEVDPSQMSRLEEAKRKLRSMETGTDATTQQALSESRRMTEATKSDLSKVTGGNIAGTVDALLKAQRLGGRAGNQAFAQAGQRASGFQSLVDRMATRVEERKRQIQQDKSDQQRAYAEEAVQSGMQNAITGLTSLAGEDIGAAFGGGDSDPMSSEPFLKTPSTFGSGAPKASTGGAAGSSIPK